MIALLHLDPFDAAAALRALLAAAAGGPPRDAHRRPDPGVDDDEEEPERPIGDPDEDDGPDDDDEDDDDEEPLQCRCKPEWRACCGAATCGIIAPAVILEVACNSVARRSLTFPGDRSIGF